MSKVSAILVLIMVSGLILSGCGPATAEPSPEPAQPSTGDTVEPPDPVRARDAVLDYLAEAYGDGAPALGMNWTEEDVTPDGLVGSSAFKYTLEGWEITVTFPVVAPEATLYQVTVMDAASGFSWQGEVDAWMGVIAAHPGVVNALATVVAYLAENYSQALPAPGMGWTEEHTKPEGLLGGEFYEYRFEGWLAAISYPVVAPSQMIYDVTVTDEISGFEWQGRVETDGQVAEGTAHDVDPGTSPEVSDAELADLVEGNTALAFDLYQVLCEEDGNLFYSPYSISMALAMTYAGARGETELQMAEALSFLLTQERLHPAFHDLDLELAERGEGAEGSDSEGFRLNIANALWGQEGESFLPQFLDLLAENYGAGMRLVDFAGAAEKARETINRWISEQTEERIPELIPQGVLNSATALVLTNAIYFNAAWAEPFAEEMTKDSPFYLMDGGQVTVPMMAQSKMFPYADGQGYQAVELPYDGGELSMLILLPDQGEFVACEGSLDANRLAAILESLERQQVALELPKFEFDSAFNLEKALAALGMPVAFTGGADFSGMTGARGLFIGNVIHKAFVSVDEAGTEAAAATAVVMQKSAMPGEPVKVTVDRPFLFLIRDNQTGTVLFVGRVMNPSS